MLNLLDGYPCIITYQVITGNYSGVGFLIFLGAIITYQVITGNYSLSSRHHSNKFIITYQVITGNYSHNPLFIPFWVL